MDPNAAGQADQEEVDQMIGSVLADMQAQGVDLTQPMFVEQRLTFPSDEQALRAGADLIGAGWPGVRIEGGMTALHLPTVSALFELTPTVEAFRSVRQQLVGFAAARGGSVIGSQEGADSPFGAGRWPPLGGEPLSETEMRQQDQDILDHLFAYDIDLKQPVILIAGVGFPAEQQARGAAAELFLARWPEVHVVTGISCWVVEVVTTMVLTVAEVSGVRVRLSEFAGPRGGSFVGFSTMANAPKQVLEDYKYE